MRMTPEHYFDNTNSYLEIEVDSTQKPIQQKPLNRTVQRKIKVTDRRQKKAQKKQEYKKKDKLQSQRRRNNVDRKMTTKTTLWEEYDDDEIEILADNIRDEKHQDVDWRKDSGYRESFCRYWYYC